MVGTIFFEKINTFIRHWPVQFIRSYIKALIMLHKFELSVYESVPYHVNQHKTITQYSYFNIYNNNKCF